MINYHVGGKVSRYWSVMIHKVDNQASQYISERCDNIPSKFDQIWEKCQCCDRKEKPVAGIIWNRARGSLNVYNIHSSWRHLRSKSTLANLGSYASDLLTQSLTESPYMNVDFYSHRELLHQNVLRIFGTRQQIYFRSRNEVGTKFFFLRLVWVDIILLARQSIGLKCAVMVTPKSNGVQYGHWLTIAKSLLCWGIWSPIRVVRKASLLAQPQSVPNFWDVCDWFRFIISTIFKQKCNVTPAWCVACTIHEICANKWDLCDDSDGIWAFPGYTHSDWAGPFRVPIVRP